MSLLIVMPDQTDQLCPDTTHDFHTEIANLLECPEYSSAVVFSNSASSIKIALPKNSLTFIRDTQWSFQLKSLHLKIIVTFIKCTGTSLLCAQSQRMKLELMILLRFVNSKLPIEENYSVEPRTGLIQYSFQIPWRQYKQKLGRINCLRKLFGYMLYQLNLYAQVLLFCESGNSELFKPNQFYKQHPNIESVNRVRFLLRNTHRFRQANMLYLEAIAHLKQQLRNDSQNLHLKDDLQHTLCLFHNNLQCFERMRVGLEGQQSQQKLQSCLKHISKNAVGKESNRLQSGIVRAIRIKKQGEVKALSMEGAHSEILIGKFVYSILPSIYFQGSQKPAEWIDGKETRGDLVAKKCCQGQSSVNSFMNELSFLKYIRNGQSSYIARYFLWNKEIQNYEYNQKDFIYMKPYVQNLHNLVKKCSSLSTMQRLSLSYKLAKGFCFLGSRAVLHRDLKPHNIVLDQTRNPFIIDFGSCAPVYGTSDFRVYQPRLLATKWFHIYYHELPEEYSHLKSKFTREQYERHPLIDVYSFGRVLSFLFFKSIIPPSVDEIDVYPYGELVRNIHYLVGVCLQVDPDDRPTFAEIASFLGTLEGYTQVVPQGLQLKIRSCSEPKPKIQ